MEEKLKEQGAIVLLGIFQRLQKEVQLFLSWPNRILLKTKMRFSHKFTYGHQTSAKSFKNINVFFLFRDSLLEA